MRNEADMISEPEKDRTDDSGNSVDESWILSPGRFQHKRFWKTMGAGIGLSLIGIILIASTKNVPLNSSVSGFVSEIQKVTEFLPKTTKELLEFALGNLMLLAGVYCIFLSLKILVRYTSGRRK